MNEDFPRVGSRRTTFAPRIKKPWPYTRITTVVLGLIALAVLAFAILFWYAFWRMPDIFPTNDPEESSTSTMRPENGALLSASGTVEALDTSARTITLSMFDPATTLTVSRIFQTDNETAYVFRGNEESSASFTNVRVGRSIKIFYPKSQRLNERPLAITVTVPPLVPPPPAFAPQNGGDEPAEGVEAETFNQIFLLR